MDFLKVAVIIAFILLTIFTIKIHPQMHQPMVLEDADFVLTRISDTITSENIPVAKVENIEKSVEIKAPEQSTKKIIEVYNKQQDTVKQIKPQDTPKKIAQEGPSQMELLQRVLKNSENSKVVKQEEKPKQITQKKEIPLENTKVIDKPKTEKIQEKTVQKPSSNPYMTEEEEIIAWNKWRSNIQNQIMKDSEIEIAPLGTVFMFTFIVDKFGNVSNIKVECSHPSFMDVARNNVKPAIANLQKKPILNFPKGTKRTSTVVTGMFVIGTQTRYSTPENYSDYERVTR